MIGPIIRTQFKVIQNAALYADLLFCTIYFIIWALFLQSHISPTAGVIILFFLIFSDKSLMQHRSGGQVNCFVSQTSCGKSTVISVCLPDTMLVKPEDVTGHGCNYLVQTYIDYALAQLEIPEE